MVWHWIIFAILAILAFAESFTAIGKKTVIRICNVIILVVIFLSSIRWDQKISDWDSYYNVFQSITINSFSDLFFRHTWDFEFLFNFLLRIVKATFDNYLVVQIVMALVSVGLIYKSTLYFYDDLVGKDEQNNIRCHYIALTLLIGWSTGCLNLYAVRTTMATSICLYSIRFIDKRNLKGFAICIAAALGFHMGAVAFIPAYYLYHMRFNAKQFAKFLVATAALSIIGAPVLIKSAGILGGRIAHKVNGSYSQALGSSSISGVFAISNALIYVKAIANTALIILVILYLSAKLKNNSPLRPKVDGTCNLFLFGAMLQAVFLPYSMTASRVVVFYLNQQFFILPLVLQVNRKLITNKTIIFMLLLVYAAVKMYMLLSSHEGYWTFNNILSR